MALEVCTECGNSVSDRAAACPKCGAPVSTKAKYVPEPSHWIRNTVCLAAILFGGFLLWGFMLAGTPEGKERIKMRDAIEYCDSQTTRLKDDPRMSAGAVGLHMDACDKLRNDYRAKWSREP